MILADTRKKVSEQAMVLEFRLKGCTVENLRKTAPSQEESPDGP